MPPTNILLGMSMPYFGTDGEKATGVIGRDMFSGTCTQQAETKVSLTGVHCFGMKILKITGTNIDITSNKMFALPKVYCVHGLWTAQRFFLF